MRYVIGIDEVGRGPLAGPVTVAAIAIPKPSRFRPKKGMVSLRDSKQLTILQRERWAEHLAANPRARFAIVKKHPKAIDELNISRAANAAAKQACLQVCAALGISFAECDIYLDGGLFLGNGKKRL